MNNITMNQQLGKKWFTFYAKLRPWFACITAISLVTDFLKHSDTYAGNWWMLLYFLAGIGQGILGIMVFLKSSENYLDFVRFVKGVLFFETICFPYQQGVSTYISSKFNITTALITAFINLLLSYFVWYRLNLKYFEKRIPGGGNASFDTEQDLESDKICFCRKCGSRLDGSDVCSKCGTKILFDDEE